MAWRPEVAGNKVHCCVNAVLAGEPSGRQRATGRQQSASQDVYVRPCLQQLAATLTQWRSDDRRRRLRYTATCK